MAEKKVPHTVGLTTRQTQFAKKEAKRLGISVGEYLRRVFDEAMDRHTGTTADKLYGMTR